MSTATNTISYLHTVNAGDLIASMAGIRQIWKNTGKKAVIYQEINRYGNYYLGADHPLKDDNGIMVNMTERMFDMLKPLVESQEYVESFFPWRGESCLIDLSVIHRKTAPAEIDGEIFYASKDPRFFCNMPYGSINRWLFYAYPDMACDLSEAWITQGPFPTKLHIGGEKILLNFTSRYRNETIDYSFLKKYERNLVFAGTEDEYKSFTEKWNLDGVFYIKIDNFEQMMSVVEGALFFLGNQSFLWNLCEAMKVPRILEACPWAPNCIPVGKDAYDFYAQPALEYYFEKLINR